MQTVICQRCQKRPASAHLTELTPTGGRDELHLCASCIQQLDLHLEAGPPPIAAILSAQPLSATPVTAEPVADAGSAPGSCPECGLTFGDFETGKRFGCAHDYALWETQLVALFESYHGASRHRGRRPGAVPKSDDLQARRARLDAALRAAVASEDFEQAAQLRDELKACDPSQMSDRTKP
jgi:protein arginine kinase activator